MQDFSDLQRTHRPYAAASFIELKNEFDEVFRGTMKNEIESARGYSASGSENSYEMLNAQIDEVFR